MDFEPSDDQRLLLESVSRLLADTYSFAQRKGYMAQPAGYSPEIWGKFAELGLLGLPFPEEYGGFGGGPQEVMLVMQAFGRAIVVEPFLSTVVLCGTAIQAAGSADQKNTLLPAIAEGSLKMAFAHGEWQARYDLNDLITSARRDGSGWVLDGAKTVVAHGEAADKFIVSARTAGDRYDRDGMTLFVVDANAEGMARRGYVSRDDSRAADLSLSNVRVDEADVLGPIGG
ncbi:MAG: acyl-CoA dehydrogenase family protein, partial [Rhodospirillales bacterium]|nr:acyl-CoA dehydrogenase family protein [Rhodospirillales bacterium]